MLAAAAGHSSSPAQYIAAAGAGASTPVSLASTTLALHN